MVTGRQTILWISSVSLTCPLLKCYRPDHEKKRRRKAWKSAQMKTVGQCLLYLWEILKLVIRFCSPALQVLLSISILKILGSFLVGNSVEGDIFWTLCHLSPPSLLDFHSDCVKLSFFTSSFKQEKHLEIRLQMVKKSEVYSHAFM